MKKLLDTSGGKLLEIAGVRLLGFINENIRKGEDYEGKKYAYSEKSFYRPYDEKIYKKIKRNPSLFKIVTNKSGELGFIIHGYKRYKEFMNPAAKNSFLTGRGEMLRNMNITNVTDTEVVIGFTDPEQGKKAFWFNVSGVGKSRKLWKFLGINDKQKKELYELLGVEFKTFVVDELGKIIDTANTK
ncbi:MAG TPA: hypothetical protein PL041_02230 [Melioribacteraceae bacterium]|nr:hypothetical protein [Melioribacteraceae bacterium]